MDYIGFDDGFAMVKTSPPAFMVGQHLAQTTIRSRYGVTVVAIKRPSKGFSYATADTIVAPGRHHHRLRSGP